MPTPENLASDIVSRMPALMEDSRINAEAVVANLVRDAMLECYRAGQKNTMEWVSKECKRMTQELMEKNQHENKPSRVSG